MKQSRGKNAKGRSGAVGDGHGSTSSVRSFTSSSPSHCFFMKPFRTRGEGVDQVRIYREPRLRQRAQLCLAARRRALLIAKRDERMGERPRVFRAAWEKVAGWERWLQQRDSQRIRAHRGRPRRGAENVPSFRIAADRCTATAKADSCRKRGESGLGGTPTERASACILPESITQPRRNVI